MLTKFLTSKGSGWLSIISTLAVIGGGVWFWYELKEFGGLEQKAESQARDIKSLENQVSYMDAQNDLKQEIGKLLEQTQSNINRRYEAMRLDFQEALKDAPQEYIDCRNMVVPERLRHPDRNQDSQD